LRALQSADVQSADAAAGDARPLVELCCRQRDAMLDALDAIAERAARGRRTGASPAAGTSPAAARRCWEEVDAARVRLVTLSAAWRRLLEARCAGPAVRLEPPEWPGEAAPSPQGEQGAPRSDGEET
jgi:hypothetical protein